MSHTATCDLLGEHTHDRLRRPQAAPPQPERRDDAAERRAANRAIAVSALGLAATGLVEIVLAW
jgi:hypothetical protein